MKLDTDAALVDLVADMKHHAKAGLPYSPMRADFVALLDDFITRWKLDGDPHEYATVPTDTTSEEP